MSGSDGLPDWRDASAYEPLLFAGRAAFAWEWLRRQPAYRAESLRARAERRKLPLGILAEDPLAARWGLHAFEDPRHGALKARPVWRAERHPSVLGAQAGPRRADPDAFLLDRISGLATLVSGPGVERLLLSDGNHSIRLDVRGTSLLSGPVWLNYDMAGVATARRMIPVLQAFISLASNGTFSRSLRPVERRGRRQILLLRTHDALQQGADQRTIAAVLLSNRAEEGRWRVKSPSLRSQAQRLVKASRAIAHGRFWDLLR